MFKRRIGTGLIGTLALLSAGCATDPAALRVPKEFTCFSLDAPLVAREKRGEPEAEWVVRLASGPYFSEKVDGSGTYFRALPGGVYQGRPDRLSAPAGPATHLVSDGGVFVPHDGAQAPRVYTYASAKDAATTPYSSAATCELAGVVHDRARDRLSLWVPDPSLPNPSPTQDSTDPGSTLETIAMRTHAIRAEGGKLELGLPLRDPAFVASLRSLTKEAVPIFGVNGTIEYASDRSRGSARPAAR